MATRFWYHQFTRREGWRWLWSVVIAEGDQEAGHGDGWAVSERRAEKRARKFIRAHHEANR